jgi:carbon-monoxide dehydrogenase small subunit
MSSIAISLTVNGEARTLTVEPREHLADVLRGRLFLTGTHLGCEHGVCGACTVELDGAPARACIAHAGACHGATVRTVEGFADDAAMAELREAFAAEHALQCGYCTPGMLIAARDVVLRLPDADEARVREEMAGNLCRCTGYRGIVRAILRVLAGRRAGRGVGGGGTAGVTEAGRPRRGGRSPSPAPLRGAEAAPGPARIPPGKAPAWQAPSRRRRPSNSAAKAGSVRSTRSPRTRPRGTSPRWTATTASSAPTPPCG